jgi:peroxiredoxin
MMPRTQGVSRRRPAYLPGLLPILTVAVLAAAALSRYPQPAGRSPAGPRTSGAVAGAEAPDFAAMDVRGGVHALREMSGKVVLLSFLEVQAPAGSPEAHPSRAQITFLKSMHTQYAPKGLVVLLIDGSRLRSGAAADPGALYNATFDWNLGDIPVINDDQQESLTSRYAVTALPATFLIGPDGRIVERWEGVASTPQLSRRLQQLLGPPVVPR